MEEILKEKPKAIELLEQAWPNLSETNKIRLAAMAETIAMMSERRASQRQEATA